MAYSTVSRVIASLEKLKGGQSFSISTIVPSDLVTLVVVPGLLADQCEKTYPGFVGLGIIIP